MLSFQIHGVFSHTTKQFSDTNWVPYSYLDTDTTHLVVGGLANLCLRQAEVSGLIG